MDSILPSVLPVRNAQRRFWVFSDLQQSDPVNARRCMHAGVEDFLSLRLPVDAVCYLGDSTEGTNLSHLREMADMQVDALARVDAPVWYVMGNHELDYHRHSGEEAPGAVTVPMRERILREPQWHTTATVRDWLLVADFGGLALALFSDHTALDGSWYCSHGGTRGRGGPDDVLPSDPHDGEIEEVRARIAGIGKPVFTMSHYAFPGGNRSSNNDLQGRLFPLPPNVVAHFYGHSHIGDHYWGREHYLRQISGIDESAVTQFDIASLENRRGNAVRSAIVEWYGGASYGVFFRNHSARCWEKAFVAP